MAPSHFLNAVSPVTDPLSALDTHNPIYHLRRYVEGNSHEALVMQGINPGSWDLSPQEILLTNLDFGGTQAELFDVTILAGPLAGELRGVAHFDHTTLTELSAWAYRVPVGTQLAMAAASTIGGGLDVTLSSGDPSDPANLQLQTTVGTISGILVRLLTPSRTEYAQLADVQLIGNLAIAGDVDGDARVDAEDLLILAASFGKHLADPGYDPRCDFNADDCVDISDLLTLAGNWGV
jgi:hypothetical protein